MLGAIVGDIVGSIYEFHNHRSKDFELFGEGATFTDDTVMTLAIAKALCTTQKNGYKGLYRCACDCMRELGNDYPDAGYGARFAAWLTSPTPKPYSSYGNGAAMRVSAVGFIAKTLDEAQDLSEAVTVPTHNHMEAIKGAEAVSSMIFLAKKGATMLELRDFVVENYYDLDFTLDSIRDTYAFNETCQDTVPQAIEAFLESVSFEDAIRGAISIGGDSDTIAAITGSIAEAYYGVPPKIREEALSRLDDNLRVLFETLYPVVCKK